jgi:uncharacterized membrane protein YtjA (UPF0391 family)
MERARYGMYKCTGTRLGSLARRQEGVSEIKGGNMLYWTVMFLIISLVAAVLGFTGVAVAAAGIARIIFFLFLILFLASLVGSLVHRA